MWVYFQKSRDFLGGGAPTVERPIRSRLKRSERGKRGWRRGWRLDLALNLAVLALNLAARCGEAGCASFEY
jgi:hypothetical protein